MSRIGCGKVGGRLEAPPTYLNSDRSSWYILKRKWRPTPSPEEFDAIWNLHPSSRHKLKLFGRVVEEKRWSTAWGVAYRYSGTVNPARPISASPMVAELLSTVNDLVEQQLDERPYNACLQNWYTVNDSIGLHADDERQLRADLAIFSLSWGGTRRFLLRPRQTGEATVELFLGDGDLLVMGGACQVTHRHQVPKWRPTKDPPTAPRINWTLRAFVDKEENDKQEKKKRRL